MVVENDPTQGMAQPGVIVAAIRAGGTFLSHCLSNHPRICCDRGEPLHHKSSWRRSIGGDVTVLLRALLNQTGYHVSMCKLTYTQAFHRDVWPEVLDVQPRVIWLRRDNLIRQALSVAINKRARAGQLTRPQHTFLRTAPVAITISPAQFLRYCEMLDRQNAAAEKRLRDITDVLPVTYEEITENARHPYMATGLNPKAGARLCEFLGVPAHPMPADLRRVNPGPVSDLLANWQEIRDAIAASAYADMAERERHWTR